MVIESGAFMKSGESYMKWYHSLNRVKGETKCYAILLII